MIAPEDQHKTTFTCPFGTFEFRRMPFSLCNAPGKFQRCMMAIFSNFLERSVEIFVGFLALNLKLIYFNYSINLCFDDNKSDFFY